MGNAVAPQTSRASLLLLPFAALLATLPLVMHGCSCGHDFDFHLQSWLDAAKQLRHGTLLPRWAFTPAWNAGEPRFIFYPPLSWMLGAVLTMLMPVTPAPIVFTWLALTAAAFTMYRLAREFSTPNAALVVSALYIANPYMLFTAFERTAYAELLAAAWMPLLLLAALREKPTLPSIAIPVALLWLTNAPAAVIGCYAFAVVIAIRLAMLLIFPQRRLVPLRDAPAPIPPAPLALLLRAAGGTALGLALAAFYLIPAAYERRYVQIAMAVIANMRFQDNFLFGHTGSGPHDQVLHTASLIAVVILIAAVSALLVCVKLRFGQSKRTLESPLIALCGLTLVIAFLLTPTSMVLWNHLPELAFLQFPWRMLAMLSVVAALAIAMLLTRSRLGYIAAVLAAVGVVLTLSQIESHLYRQGCEFLDRPEVRARLFAEHHGVDPTDEYTATNADNDILRWDNPGYWLADTPNGFAPNTVPNPAATIENYDTPPPMDQTVSGHAPMHFMVHAEKPEFLILNLRDYPAWSVAVSTPNAAMTQHPPHLQRDDGLIAIPLLYRADFTVDIRWQRTFDETLGLLVSGFALLVLSLSGVGSRRLRS